MQTGTSSPADRYSRRVPVHGLAPAELCCLCALPAACSQNTGGISHFGPTLSQPVKESPGAFLLGKACGQCTLCCKDALHVWCVPLLTRNTCAELIALLRRDWAAV